MATNINPTNDNLLLSKHKYELSQLLQIFPDWSKQDLLTTLDEANGDLDLAVSRISEGLAQQWGDVTKQKRKPEKQKLKTEVISSSHNSLSTPFDSRPPKRDFVDNGGRGRGGFAGRGGRGGRGRGRGGPTIAYVRPPRQQFPISDELTTEDTSISENKDFLATEHVSNSVVHETPFNEKDSPPTSKITHQKANVPTPLPQSVQINKSTPMNAKTSWAQLVKGPEPVTPPVVPKDIVHPEVTRQPPQPLQNTHNTTSPQITHTPARNVSPQRSTSPEKSATVQRTPSPTPTPAQKTQQPQTTESIAPLKSPASRSPSPTKQQLLKSPVSVTPSVPASVSPSPQTYIPEQNTTQSISVAPPGLKQTKPQAQRTLNQDAAVIMPTNTSLSSVGVQFGSLNIHSVAPEEDETATESVTQATVSSVSIPAQIQSTPSPKFQQSVPSSVGVSLPLNLSQRAPVSMPINSYVQPISQFGLGQMASHPGDYSGLYNSEAQARVAAAM
ncbi:hypothetical protein HK096_005672, partial [Nowakowskiella sp. JEL0078]